MQNKQVARKIDSSTESVGELLRKPFFYRVPAYQRDFAWNVEEVEALWEDVTRAILDDRSEYFLGAVVLSHSVDDKVREIVDGQQRLATISMIFSAIVRKWKHNGDQKRSYGVFHDYLGAEDRRTGENVPKLKLNENNDSVFQDLVLGQKSFVSGEKRNWSYSNRLLDEAYRLIVSKVDDWVEKSDTLENALIELEEFVAHRTKFIVIEVGDESDAFVIFETLNDRGLDLAVSDLVKNYLFSKSGANIERFKRIWVEITLLVGAENLTSFLRHYWLSEYGLVRERDLYRVLRESVRGAAGARQLMEKLRKVADFYAALVNPEHTYWTDFPPEVRSHLEALILFKVTQFRPMALAAMERSDHALVRKLLKMLVVISFRYTVVSSLGTGNLEKVYTDAALAIRHGRASTGKDIFLHLKSIYVNDDTFVSDFSRKRFSKSNIARYVLAELNDHMEGNSEYRVAENTGRITLEHVMPKNPSVEWKRFFDSEEDLAEYVDLIGNLTLLEKGANRGIANADFVTKKEKAFSKSRLSINQVFKDKDNWLPDDITSRSQELANLAKKVWRIDY